MPGGWHPDPYGRADQRYWDGERWTEHIVRAGVVERESVGAPAPASGLRNVLDHLGPDAKERPAPDLFGALSAGGASLVAAGALVLFAGDDDSRAGIIIGSIVLVIAGYVVAALLGARLRPAAVALAAIGIVVFVPAAFADTLDDGEATGPLLVLALLAGVMYAAPILRGRPLLLGIALTSLVAWVTYIAAKGDLDRTDELSSAGLDTGSTTAQSAYAVLLIAGVTLLVVALFLDRAGYHGVATVFIAVAVISVVSGSFGVASELGEAGGALLMGFAGLALAIVGDLGQRRFTTWLGAIAVPSALAALVFTLVSDDDRVGGGILLAVFGAALVVVCLFLPQIRQSREGGRGVPTAL